MDSVAENYQIRISEQAFTIALAIFLSIAFIFACLRTIIRFHQNRRFYADDYFLFYALCAGAAACGVALTIRDQIYLQIRVGLGQETPAPDFYEVMLVFEKRIQVCSVLVWSLIYAIKASFLAFFRKLVNRVYKLELYWRVVVGITAICAAASIPLSFVICAHFGEDYMTYCPIDSQLYNEGIYLYTTTALDVFTDVLLISIPAALLWNVRISTERRLTLLAMLSLSIFCIIVSILKTAGAKLPVNGVYDTAWHVFFSGIECAVAIIIVSCTAFRGLFGSEGAFTKRRAAAKKVRPGELPGSDDSGRTRATSSDSGRDRNSKQGAKTWYKCGRRDSALDTMLDNIPSMVQSEERSRKEVTFQEVEIEDIEAQRDTSRNGSENRGLISHDKPSKALGYSARVSAG